MKVGNLMIVQGGGPTAVFNTSLAAIVQEAQLQPRIGRILGSRAGIRGLLAEDIAELTNLSAADLNRLRHTPGAALGSSRYQPSEADLDRLATAVRHYDIEFMLFLGGNGTMRGAELISRFLASRSLEIHIAGVPKTVDNDIMETDRCPGFASAARYMATCTRELGADIRSLPQPVTILETMGRTVGWIAAATVLAHFGPETNGLHAPHIICIPELPFATDPFIDQVDHTVKRHGHAVVVVAEGIIDTAGRHIYENVIPTQADALKRPMVGGVGQHLANVLSQRLHFRCRNEKPGLLGRSSIILASHQDRLDAALVGREGVCALIHGHHEVMVALQPLSAAGPGFRLVPLAQVAGRVRHIPAHWLTPASIPVTQPFLDYLAPLVGTLDDHLTALPQAHIHQPLATR
jgi:6-phosphofructokinase